jgi:hypothetical protein
MASHSKIDEALSELDGRLGVADNGAVFSGDFVCDLDGCGNQHVAPKTLRSQDWCPLRSAFTNNGRLPINRLHWQRVLKLKKNSNDLKGRRLHDHRTITA